MEDGSGDSGMIQSGSWIAIADCSGGTVANVCSVPRTSSESAQGKPNWAIARSTSPTYASIVRRQTLACLLLVFGVGCHRPSKTETVQRVVDNSTVTVTDVRFWSPAIKDVFWYRIIAPKAEPNERLPVLYLLHGANSGPLEIMERSDVVNLAVTARLIAVMPDAGYCYYTNAKHKPNARWENAVTGELRQDVETRFPGLRGREHTGISGISMGGYGAVKLALKHPELY